jgi:hypothetical protein
MYSGKIAVPPGGGGIRKKKQASSSIVFLSFVAPETHPSSFRIKEKIIESPRTAKSDLEA